MEKKRRSPVVVVMGHVDHGKTSLLDYIRRTNRAAKEFGGITQSIGAYEAEVNVAGYDTNKITFIDTPGHEAFTKLRARGANVADIAILIIDAVDSIMPQTVESIYHIKSAKIPYIVAINKIDLPGANLSKVKNDLIKHEVIVEDMGGDVPVVPLSAKSGEGVDRLLETILLMTDMHEFTYSPDGPVKAYIIESTREKGGVIASVIIKDGTLKVGEEVYALDKQAKIKALINDHGQNIKEVVPSMPFALLGFKEVPEVGIELTDKPVITEKIVAEEKPANFDDFFKTPKKEGLKLIIKTESQGSLDALQTSLAENENIEVVLASVGEINKSDIFLARLNKAIVIGFSVHVDKAMIEFAEQEKVVIKTYSLIYELLDELNEVSNLMQEKESKEKQLKGEAKILAQFIIEKERIAGVKVTKGKINLGDQIELFRNDKLVNKTKVVSLKTRAREINELKKNEDGGMMFFPQLDFQVGDVVKSYSI